jgi:sigma-54 dependent transcriptional regulator, acetoin dehydrogenase operon transcriptional activator AcoR
MVMSKKSNKSDNLQVDLATSPDRARIKVAWERFIETGSVDSSVIRREIRESWKRCRDLELDPFTDYIGAEISRKEKENSFARNSDLLTVARPFLKNLFELIRSLEFVIFLTDRNGFILEAIGEGLIWEYCQHKNAVVGSSFAEKYSGTTAPGIAMVTDKPYQMVAEEHYLSAIHLATCAAAPIHDDKGNVIACLDFTASYEAAQRHPHTMGMIAAAAQVIEDQLKLQKEWEKSFLANQYLEATMQSMELGVIFLNGDDTVSYINPTAEGIIGLASAKITGKKVDRFFNNRILLSAIKRDEELQDQELFFLELGQKSRFLTSYKSITSPTGKRLGSVIILKELQLVQGLVQLLAGFHARYRFEDIKGNSSQILETLATVKSIVNSPSNVMITGESGTGKEMLAQSIHNGGLQADGPFVAINSTAIPRDLVESELFGYEAGTFTGGSKGGRPGKFEMAYGGTLFLDEIDSMTLDMQVKLLRVLEEKRFQRLGGKSYLPLNARIIVATSRNLREEVENGSFRSDLYYRLNVLEIHVPPLRERRGDIEILARIFIEEISRNLGKKVEDISSEALTLLESQPWPGNVRELKNWIERAINLTGNTVLEPGDFPQSIQQITGVEQPVIEHERNASSLQQSEIEAIKKSLVKNQGNLSQAAVDLGIGRTTLYRKISKYGITLKKTVVV